MSAIVRVYDNYLQAKTVVANLESAGVPSNDISLVANKNVSSEHATVANASEAGPGAGLGAAMGGGAGLLAGLGIMAIPGIGPVVAVGWLASTALGALAGATAGGLIGAMVDSGVPEENAHVYSEAVRRGGTLVTVRTTTVADAKVAAIMDEAEPIDAHERRNNFIREGWTKYDPAAPDYSPIDADTEKMRRS